MKKVLAFDIGGTNTRLALVNENFKIEKELITKTPYGDEKKFIENCVKMVEQFPLENVVAIAAGVPGLVDKKKGIIISLVNVGIYNVKFSKVFKEKFNLNLYLRNDAEVACLGEAYLGAGKGYERAMFLTVSTGLGVALCVNEKIDEHITEVGHTLFNYKGTIMEYEKTISGFNIPNFAKQLGYKINSAKELFEGVKANKKDCVAFYKEWFSLFDQFVKLMINSYSPDIICMTGGLMKSKEVFFKDLVNLNKDVKIVECKYSESAGLMGSAVYAFQCAKII